MISSSRCRRAIAEAWGCTYTDRRSSDLPLSVALRSYNWPGNIRELQNVIERAILLCDGRTITPEHLGDLALTIAPRRTSLGVSVREEKQRRVEQAVADAGGNLSEAARRLGLAPSNLRRLMRSLGLKSPGALQ